MKQLNLAGHKLLGLLDRFNDKLTSYRLMLYFLLSLVGWTIIGSFWDKVPYNWHQILLSAGFLLVVCWITNKVISKFLNIPANKESDLITALILALILSPPTTLRQFALVAAAAVAAMASKYIITVYRSHIFNPAALGAFVAGEIFHQYPSWWVGTKFTAPIIALGGLLILRKMKRFGLFGTFVAVFLLYLIFTNDSGSDWHFLWQTVISTPALFFAVVMLIEPLTSPTLASRYMPYAVLVGLCYSITKLKLSPEEALLIGNIFTFFVATNRRYTLKYMGKAKEAEGIISYGFEMPKDFKFQAGQYMEWTVPSAKSDSRGNRRYFTVSSSPSERSVMFTVKQPSKASAFKQRLESFNPGDRILASHVAGSFTLPKDINQKVAFMAGGIGVTPFRSMIKYSLDNNQHRDMALLYSATSPAEFSFTKLFDSAKNIGLKTSYVTDGIDSYKIVGILPDWKERVFYVSGPYGFVQAMEGTLLSMGVGTSKIINDYFPGYG